MVRDWSKERERQREAEKAWVFSAVRKCIRKDATDTENKIKAYDERCFASKFEVLHAMDYLPGKTKCTETETRRMF